MWIRHNRRFIIIYFLTNSSVVYALDFTFEYDESLI